MKTEDELEKALAAAMDEPKKLIFIEIALESRDCCEMLSVIGEKFRGLSKE